MSEIDDFINMIDAKMDKGVSRLRVEVSEELSQGEVRERYHHGRCDVGSPWARGTVTNCDAVDVDEVQEK